MNEYYLESVKKEIWNWSASILNLPLAQIQ